MSSSKIDKQLARWSKFSLTEQMANIGAEVGRASRWQNKGNASYSKKAFERALELIDLTLSVHISQPKLKELARLREVLVDYFFGENIYNSTEESFQKYFLPFNYAARKST